MNQLLLKIYSNLPAGVSVRIRCAKRRRYWVSRKVIFIHVPKVAGTSISHALYGQFLSHIKASEIKHACPVLFDSYFKFGFTRNPWDRAVSAYRFARKGSTDTGRITNPQLYRKADFRTFDVFIYEWLASQDITKIDYVFQPQHLFILDAKGTNLLDFVGKVETLDEDIQRVSALINRDLEIPVLNRTSEPGSYKRYYNDRQLVNMVGDIYSQDIEFFNYDF